MRVRIHGPSSLIDPFVVVFYWLVIGKLSTELRTIRIDYPTRPVLLVLILETLVRQGYFNPEPLVSQAGRFEVVCPKAVL